MPMQSITAPLIYKDIPGWPGYEADNCGDIWSRRTFQGGIGEKRRQLRKRPDKDGYLTAVLCCRGRRQTFKVAHLVLMAFIGPRPLGTESLHGPDPNPLNNRPENLRWGTHRENIDDKVLMGTVARGERHGNSRLTAEDVADIRRLRAEGKTLKFIGDAKGVSKTHIGFIIKGRYWKHV